MTTVPPNEPLDGPPEPAALPPATRPGPVRLQVADLSRALPWYGDVLGLRLLGSGPGWARLGALPEAPAAAPAPPPGPHLVELVEQPGASPVPRRGHLGLYHVAILLPDRSDLGRFVAHLARLRIPVGSADHRVSEAIYLNDPDGLGFEVYADRPRAEWHRTPAGEVAMATDPLDLDDLVRVGGGVGWNGLPEGARIGHLHLHVGDLAAAEAFYAEALGLEVQARSYPGALFLSAGGYHHHLGVNTWARGAEPARADEARLLSWSLEVPHADEVAAALHRLEAADHRVNRIDPGIGRARDPWGTELEVRVADGGGGEEAPTRDPVPGP